MKIIDQSLIEVLQRLHSFLIPSSEHPQVNLLQTTLHELVVYFHADYAAYLEFLPSHSTLSLNTSTRWKALENWEMTLPEKDQQEFSHSSPEQIWGGNEIPLFQNLAAFQDKTTFFLPLVAPIEDKTVFFGLLVLAIHAPPDSSRS